ncbi:MAG: methylated-DNA--[protein]-cysteine S-methyltransferase [Verrucomicrobiota bacterium]
MSRKIKLYDMMKRLPQDAVAHKIDSPVGDLTLIASAAGLHALLWNDDWLSKEFITAISRLPRTPGHPVITRVADQLNEYFQGSRTAFDIPLCPDGTEFQLQAWQELTRIPYGKTISYQDQAIALGDPNKVRAIGGANGRNPISIIVPCHRVIAKNGKLQGFGGGLKIKEFLLRHENPELF